MGARKLSNTSFTARFCPSVNSKPNRRENAFKLSVDIRCNGEYTYKMVDPLLFYTSIAGNVADSYDKESIADILKSELLSALQPALAKVSAQQIEYYELPAHTTEIRNALVDVLRLDWTETRGLELFKITINSLSIPEDQRKKITEWEENAMTTNPNIAGARVVGAQADAMRTAAANENGAMTGFMYILSLHRKIRAITHPPLKFLYPHRRYLLFLRYLL